MIDITFDILKQTVSFLISIGIVALLSFIFREWIKRFLDHYYISRESKATFDNQVRLEVIKQRMPMMVEITQTVYKSRNYAKQIINSNTVLLLKKGDFLESASLLTERLYMYRVLFDEDIFTLLHDFKRACQDFSMYLDVSDRPENLRVGKHHFSEDFARKLNDIFKQMDDLYVKITAYFQSKYKLDMRE